MRNKHAERVWGLSHTQKTGNRIAKLKRFSCFQERKSCCVHPPFQLQMVSTWSGASSLLWSLLGLPQDHSPALDQNALSPRRPAWAWRKPLERIGLFSYLALSCPLSTIPPLGISQNDKQDEFVNILRGPDVMAQLDNPPSASASTGIPCEC